MFGSFHFSFFVLVDEVTKNENRQGNAGKTKMKNNKKTKQTIM